MKKNIPIGLIIISHGNLARELLATLEHVVGAQSHIKTISIGTDDDMEQRRSDILKAVGEVDQGAGVIVLTDMFGGTPSNLAISVMDKAKVEIIAGVNLPMLVKLVEIRAQGTLKAISLQARKAGREYIHIASQLLAEKNKIEKIMPKDPLKEACAEVTIRNMRGLHARASRKFAEMAQSFDAEISVKHAGKDDAQAVNGASIMDLMMLAAQPGVKLHITARGHECEQALEALTALANDYFDETD